MMNLTFLLQVMQIRLRLKRLWKTVLNSLSQVKSTLNAVTIGAMQVIKIWLLISMVSMPGMPSVNHTAELWFDEPKCEARRVDIENALYNAAAEQGSKAQSSQGMVA